MELEKSQVPPEINRTKILFLLGRLSVSLGCYKPKYENFLVIFEPEKPKADIRPTDIKQHFKYLQSTTNPLGETLQQLRSQIFSYLYGKLLKLEKSPEMQAKYLTLFYKLFDADKPKKSTLSEALLYQEKYIDRLSGMIQKFIHFNVTKLQTSEMTKKIHELCKKQSRSELSLKSEKSLVGFAYIEHCLNLNQPRLKGLSTETFRRVTHNMHNKMKSVGFAYIEHYAPQLSLNTYGLRWEMGTKTVRNLPQRITTLASHAKESSCEIKGVQWQWAVQTFSNLPDQLQRKGLSTADKTKMLRNDESYRKTLNGIDFERHIDLLDGFALFALDGSEDSSLLDKTSAESELQTEYSLPEHEAEVEQVDESYQSVEIPSPLAESLCSIRERFHHQRYVIAAPYIIVHLFRCNPSYHCAPSDPQAPNFLEQLSQFGEIMALAGKECTLDAKAIRERIKLTMRLFMYEPRWSPDLGVLAISMIKLHELLTHKEQREYELLHWQHRDCGAAVELSSEQRQRDVLHGMLGVECVQLKPSAAQKYRLLLRYPHHQQSLSESYLLLSLGHLGYYYKTLQQQQLRLCRLGDSGVVLARCLREELLVLYRFHQLRQQSPQSLFLLYLQTRALQLRFQWLLHIAQGLNRTTPLLRSLYCQLGQCNEDYDELLQEWLCKASQPLLGRMCVWLLTGELPRSKHKDFFVVAHHWEESSPFYWPSHFKLIVELLPPFLDRNLADLLLSVGRSQHYARTFLNSELEISLELKQLQQELTAACIQLYWKQNDMPMKGLFRRLHLETSGLLLQELSRFSQTPLEILSKLHQYVLLTDVEFVRELIEKLEPALEQSVECFDVQQMNGMLEQLLDQHNEQLRVDRSKQTGQLCWNSFLLSWRLPDHWLALIGHRLAQYSSCFRGLWEFHHADYVLSERIRRHQSHFLERIGVEPSEDALCVTERFEQFIEKLIKFISTLGSYFFDQVLSSGFEKLYMCCTNAKTLDELLDLHAEYLAGIECGVLQTKLGSGAHQYLVEIYSIVFRLDTEQQKFLTLSQLIKRANNSVESKEFHWSCLNTYDILNALDEQFQRALVNFLLALHSSGSEQFHSLAKKIDHNRFYAKKFKELEQVNTFRFQRKLIKRQF